MRIKNLFLWFLPGLSFNQSFRQYAVTVRRKSVFPSIQLTVFLIAVVSLALPLCACAQTFELPGAVSVNQVGAATYSIPIDIAPGTPGIAPSLSLNYNSQGPDGWMGVGWSLGGLSYITRCPQTMAQDGVVGAVNNDTHDRFCLDGQRLMVVGASTYGADGAQYRTERESYTEVISHGATGSGPTWFEVRTKSGLILEYGNTTDSRVLANGAAPVMTWGLDKSTDHKGNYYTVSYYNTPAYSIIYPISINYTGNSNTGLAPYSTISFGYNLSPTGAIRISHQAGIESGGYLTLSTISADTVVAGTAMSVSNYALNYAQSPFTAREELTSVQKCNGSGNCLPPTNFTWPPSAGLNSFTIPTGAQGWCPVGTAPGWQIAGTGDFNGDGKADLACITANTDGEVTTYQVQIGFSDGAGNFNSPAGKRDMTCQNYAFADFNGDGKTDIYCYGASNNHVYISNGDGTFTAGPSLVLGCGPVSTIFGYSSDFNGDGRADIACRNVGTGSFQIYLASPSGTTFTAGSATTLPTGCNIFYGDFNGDGENRSSLRN